MSLKCELPARPKCVRSNPPQQRVFMEVIYLSEQERSSTWVTANFNNTSLSTGLRCYYNLLSYRAYPQNPTVWRVTYKSTSNVENSLMHVSSPASARSCGSGCIVDNSAMHLRFILGCYCLITVPSRRRISLQPPFSGLAVKGALAASFSSISMPQPGFSLTHR
jgi:hypothetical protein